MKNEAETHSGKHSGRKFTDGILSALTRLSAAATFLVLIGLIGYILVKGVPFLSPSLFAFEYNSKNVSLFPALITTVMTVGLSLAIAVPLGVFAAVYLVEYARRGNRFASPIRATVEALAGIPSIIYGLFGWLFFVMWLGWGFSLLAGSCTLAVMILPLILRTSEESLKAVSDSYREASFGLGAGRLRTVFRIVLPSAAPGILGGVILAVGRVVGETAALVYTAGTVARIPETPFASGRTLAVHMYALSGEGLYTGQAYATAVVLLILVMGINAASAFLAGRIAHATPRDRSERQAERSPRGGE